jgi:ATP-dependent Lhr-like helicase
MLAEGFSTKRGRRAALIHHDAVNGRLRARRGVRLLALTSGGAIPDNADYRVVLEPAETFIGTVNEDFAIESMAGDIFQLGNASWRILRVTGGMVRVADAQGQPPTIPFWLGEAPSRTHELSHAVSSLRAALDERLDSLDAALDWLIRETGLARRAALQIAEYYAAGRKVLGGLPTQQRLVLERFFDESGGMQLVIHSPFGSRLNRAWGLALRKRFCRKFNFELQAAAGDDAIVISLGTQHSFPLDEVFRYLNAAGVRNVLEQALLDAPMFTIRWRWNAACALAVPRQRGGTRVPAPLQRFEAEHLLAAVFPDQLACLEHIVGDREIPDHPLVQQAITDCLNEVMDIEGLTALLADIENGRIECVARDLPEPSPLAHEIINARPYTFLDNAPLEERRTQAVYTRRTLEAASDNELGVLDSAAIAQVQADAWPAATNADELHDALLQLGLMSAGEATRTVIRNSAAAIPGVDARGLLDTLAASGRAAEWPKRNAWLAVERIPLLRAIYTDLTFHPALTPPPGMERDWDRADAIRELIRGRLEVSGPVTAAALADLLGLEPGDIDAAMIALETEGFAMRGRFHPGAAETEWCDRRLLARIHRLTLNRLRAEIQPVSVSDFHRFLFAWQRVDPAHRASGPEGLESVLEQLDGFELPLAGWEPGVLASRMTDYDPQWLDRGCLSGRVGWGRLTPPQNRNGRPFAPLRSSPIALYQRDHIADWLELARSNGLPELSPDTQRVWETLRQDGALFFTELVRRTALLPSQVEQALSELAALGCVTSDSFDGVRALLLPSDQRPTLGRLEGKRRHNRHLASVEFAGRWSMLRTVDPSNNPENGTHAVAEVHEHKEPAIEICARVLLRRYGVLFRRLLERESLRASWFELGRVLRRWEARGEIRGGHFVSGVSGEQFALPEAIALMRSIRKQPPAAELITLSGADPLNLIGILTPGGRLPALAANRILFRDGNPVAVLESSQVRNLDAPGQPLPPDLERALTIGTLPAALRPYYG